MDASKKFNWKKITYWTLGVVLAWALFIYVGEHMDSIIQWKVDRESQAVDAAIRADEAKLAAMERVDTYGATTPEGTITLIIAALEKGDIDLASKYYYVLDQDKAKAMYSNLAKKENSLQKSVDFFKRILGGQKKCNKNSNICVFENEVAVTKDIESKTFELNSYTGVWKVKY